MSDPGAPLPYPYFTLGLEPDRASVPAQKIPTISTLPTPAVREGAKPRSTYVPSPELSHAVNVALVLGMPLLLTGPPGAGKTELATALSQEIDAPLRKFETKSTSQARDLFYTYDSMNAFKSLQDVDTRAFLTYQALGRAILEAFDGDDPRIAALVGAKKGEAPRDAVRSVVLIDEIDKAPRDFPNDLLNEIERLYFRVPELGNAASPMIGENGAVPAHLRPIVIITSNEERGLPPPFLRRCVFFQIAFPAPAAMRLIVEKRLSTLRFPEPLVDQAIAFFYALRDRAAAVGGGASTAELLSWLQILVVRGIVGDKSLKEQSALVQQSLSTLLKDGESYRRGLAYVTNEWLSSAP